MNFAKFLSWPPKGVFVELLEKHLGIITLVYKVLWACGFEYLKTFLRNFVMYEFSAAVFIKVLSYQSFDVKF